MTDKYLIIGEERYTLWDTYTTWDEALKQAKKFKAKMKSKYYILKVEQGFFVPQILYRLYATNPVRLI